jgi:hypothetical protein
MEQDPRTLAASFLSFQELTRQVPPLKLLIGGLDWAGEGERNGKRKKKGATISRSSPPSQQPKCAAGSGHRLLATQHCQRMSRHVTSATTVLTTVLWWLSARWSSPWKRQ